MKVLITAGILLVCAYCVTSTALPRLKRKEEDFEMTEDARKIVTDNANNFRRNLAKAVEISNMHELEYDSDMESQVKDFGCEGGDKLKKLEEEFERLQKAGDVDGVIKKLEGVIDDTPISCWDPERTTIACKRKLCDGKDAGNCICGPSGSKVNVKTGKAGSDCDDDEEEDEGLCSKKGASSNLFFFGTIVNMVLFYLIASFF
ncbi:hypothetical protein CRE_21816 [Caenorhabditis remanei]|uniref:Uncharacterized protein n=1 Tax=Caenorhabditis remanei TaxID=31234 RepID=E3MEM3_CAERE|nr:hypothetical protein CRE_21816 [Caenorhabditis remanei]